MQSKTAIGIHVPVCVCVFVCVCVCAHDGDRHKYLGTPSISFKKAGHFGAAEISSPDLHRSSNKSAGLNNSMRGSQWPECPAASDGHCYVYLRTESGEDSLATNRITSGAHVQYEPGEPQHGTLDTLDPQATQTSRNESRKP